MKKWLLPIVLMMSLTMLVACGGGDGSGSKGGNVKAGDTFEIGNAKVEYVGYDIQEDETGNDALVIHYKYTNNGEDPEAYFWAVVEQAAQEETGLTSAIIWTDEEMTTAVGDNAFVDVEPGATGDVDSTYILPSSDKPVTVTLEAMEGDDKVEFTIKL